MSQAEQSQKVALVLSGGGVRGAYEAGVLYGIIELLGLKSSDASPFQIFTGTSVGAINCTFLAANSHRGDLAAAELVRLWTSLDVREHLRLGPLFKIWGVSRPSIFSRDKIDNESMSSRLGRCFLDPRPLEALIQNSIPWHQLHENIRMHRIKVLIVSALEISAGHTTVFAEAAPGETVTASKDPQRHFRAEQITSDHVLASAAIPLIFPARLIGRGYFCDGGLRFNTPIAPAIRAGAEKLVVVSVLHKRNPLAPASAEKDHTIDYPNVTFLLGKLMNALLLDRVSYDLQLLERFNRLFEVLESALTPPEMEQLRKVLVETRGMPYRRLNTLVFTPSEDIGVIASEYVRDVLPRKKIGLFPKWLLEQAATSKVSTEADLASYLLFDGDFALRLVSLGRRDVLAQAEQVRQFFSDRMA